jgi:hypothetical protein
MRWLIVLLAIPMSLAAQVSAPAAVDDQVRIALSAAPPHIRVNAGVYVLGEHGYELARPSGNSFHCLVERWDGPPAPICYDRVGSESTLLVVLHLERRRAEGIDDEAVMNEIEAGYESGRFIAPAGLKRTFFTNSGTEAMTDHVLPHLPVRQWVLSLPKRVRPYLHNNPDVAGAVVRIFI